MEHQITITVTLFGEDSSYANRRRLRDGVNTALEQAELGTHVGGGTMVTGEPHYNVEFEVTDESQGLGLICNTLRDLGANHSTELSVGSDMRYNLYDDTWTNLGRRKPSPSESSASSNTAPISSPAWPAGMPTPEQVAATVDPNLAKTDFGAYLKALGDATRQAYGKKE